MKRGAQGGAQAPVDRGAFGRRARGAGVLARAPRGHGQRLPPPRCAREEEAGPRPRSAAVGSGQPCVPRPAPAPREY
eukprot:6932982-Pyramimonas_sp.AAC.1